MANVILAIILVAIIGGAICYIIREKKKGVACVGCPSAGTCAARRTGGCGAHISE